MIELIYFNILLMQLFLENYIKLFKLNYFIEKSKKVCIMSDGYLAMISVIVITETTHILQ